MVPDISLAFGPPALDPTPVQAKTATAEPAALTDSLGGFPYRSLGIGAVRMMCYGICGLGNLILDDVEDPWLHTVVVGNIVHAVQKLGVIVVGTYHCCGLEAVS